ncbi:hypothetical protein N9973_00515 [bacterium]|nr:hypothetical protein [bacterium]
MSEYFVGTTGSNSQTTFETLDTSQVLDDLQLNTSDVPIFSGLFLNGTGAGTVFSVEGSNGTFLLASGNKVLVGTGTSELYSFRVGGDSRFTDTIIVDEDISGFNDLAIDHDTLFVDASADRVGINTRNPSSSLQVVGTFSATSKSFIIDDPQNGGQLEYGVVESDQHSVLVRGENDTNYIYLPNEWEWLVDPESVTTQLTSVARSQDLFVISQDNKVVNIGGLAPNGRYNYTIYGERADIERLEVNIAPEE